MAYHTLSDLTAGYITQQELVELTNDDRGDTVVEAVWAGRVEVVDAEIDGFLGTRYSLPLVTVPVLIKKLSAQMTVEALFARRFPGELPETIKRMGDQSRALLDKIEKGRVTLGIQPAPAANSERAAQIVAHKPVFSRDLWRAW